MHENDFGAPSHQNTPLYNVSYLTKRMSLLPLIAWGRSLYIDFILICVHRKLIFPVTLTTQNLMYMYCRYKEMSPDMLSAQI